VRSLLLAVVIGAVVVAVAVVLRRRQGTQIPTQPRHQVPVQVDRADFVRPDAPWLVAVFTSSTCHVCADVARKAVVLESPEVAVQEIEYTTDRALHSRYSIDAVPAVVIVDADGVVRGSFLGPVTATDLWVAVAEARDPGSTPTSGGCQNHGRPDHDDRGEVSQAPATTD
jgi:hypothetical protein